MMKNHKRKVFDFLKRDSEEVYVLSEHLEFLCIAKIILVDLRHILKDLKTQPLWEVRCLFIHQQFLEDRLSSLKEDVMLALERIDLDDCTFSSKMRSRIYLESGYHHLQYFECGKAKEQFEKAQKCVGVEVLLAGALGKRTKFQQFDYVQLLAKANLENGCGKEDETFEVENLPKNVSLEDDTLLNEPNFTNPNNHRQEDLNPLHLALILAVCFYKQKSQAYTELLVEEILANVALLLSQPRAWCIQSLGLLLRSQYERKSSRRKERSMVQLQELVDQYENSNAKISQRIEFFYGVPFPTRWKMQRELASLYVELGVMKSALEIYERLQLWDEVINCYISLGWFEKAEFVVRAQLKIHETAKLWCLLGDVTKNEDYYRKAWDFSDHRSARAQRSLGYLFLRERKFEECIPCFQKSLEINSLQESVWFSLGCAAIATEKLDVAAKAFHWCVSMNPDNSEAWNNLSSVFVKLKHKDRAFRTLQEALRTNYDKWQIWENFLVVSADMGAFENVIEALHRLMDLKEKYLDIEILHILVNSVIDGKQDHKGFSASRLKGKVRELFGRITSQCTGNAQVWKLYSDLYKNGQTAEEKQKFLQFLVKANGVNIQSPGWEKSQESIENVVQTSLELSRAYREAVKGEKENRKAIQLLSSSKLNLKGLVVKFKNAGFQLSGEVENCINESISKLQKELETTVSAIEDLKKLPIQQIL
ncbi:tetratricopeptide repeat protein 27-like isoform X2 [Xenia sp. Carnegie-2017]|nr:tetratricopeptide repeat protein 27-like isoform X2 [Xenia sp. Carnegie-2017]